MSHAQKDATETPLESQMIEDCSPQHLMIRNALLNVPKRSCSAGFEFRLQKKLESGESALQRPVRASNWSLGWLGAGVGFAAAFAVAVFIFDFNGGPASGLQVAGTSGVSPIGTSNVAEKPVEKSTQPVQQHDIATDATKEAGNVAGTKTDSKSDSAAKLKNDAQEKFPAQTVSGNGK